MKIRNFMLSLLILATASQTFAQTGINTPWTWAHGDYTTNQPGIYAYNPQHPWLMPGARSSSGSWITSNGDLWLYGGHGYDANGSFGFLSDLWKFVGNHWVFVSGDNVKDVTTTYGSKGVATNSNNPGARGGSVSWKDNDGNLWLFGGLAPSPTILRFRNDLWKYNPALNQWTWISGDSTFNLPGVYGTQGVSSPLNKPGARSTCATWIDAAGNFWLFGGQGPDEAVFNDMWKYNPVTNEWTWVKGDQVIFQAGVYGTQGVPAMTNKPGSRLGQISWTDANGKFWLYGGSGFAESLFSGGGTLSDLWMYDPTTNEWTWVNGDKTLNAPTVFGIQGLPGPLNKPGARTGSYTWTDATGNLWLFGGWGIGTNSTYYGNFNDLWKYSPTLNQWTWMKGDQAPDHAGSYNVGGIPGFVNIPGSRSRGAAWTGNGSFWMFGGFGSAITTTPGYLNDLWSISGSQLSILPVSVTSFVSSIQGNSVHHTWKTSLEQNFSHYVMQRSLNASDFEDLATILPGIGTFKSYEYIDLDVRLRYKAKLFYRLKIVDRDGSYTFSKINVINEKVTGFNAMVYPNPVSTSAQIVLDVIKRETIELQVITMYGVAVKIIELKAEEGRNVFIIPMDHLPAASYLIKLTSSSGVVEKQLIKL